jgi:DHA1 family bicyclomycin/chloramphenicol resistance-like MFS transporter
MIPDKTETTATDIHFLEFIALLALMMSLVALSIDGMLPALSEIGRDLGVNEENRNQYIVSFLFLGLSLGQIFYGPLSDTTGRKPAIYFGFTLFIGGCIISIFSSDLGQMLVGRVLQGLGLAGPRVVGMAIVRDRFAGREMARVMSFITIIFILVPITAPAIGQMILIFFHWRIIFVFFLVLGLIIFVWFVWRLPETLHAEHRVLFSLKKIGNGVVEVCKTPVSIGYTVITGLIFGAFLGYLSSSQQIFQIQYGLGDLFPLFFGILAFSFGLSSFLNGKMVMKHGMVKLSLISLIVLIASSIIALLVFYPLAGHPPLWGLMIYLFTVMCCIGITFGNLNAAAMEPLGHIAGVGAAVVGSLSTFIAVPLSMLIGLNYDKTVFPFVVGFLFFGSISLGIMYWIEFVFKKSPAVLVDSGDP